MPHLILASSSPRRQELLKCLVPSFSTVISTVEETGSDILPNWNLEPLPLIEPFNVPVSSDPRLWAWRKGIDALSTLSTAQQEDCIVLAADTVVIAPGELLGKPLNVSDAERMLTLLRGRDHLVSTGFVLLNQSGQIATTLHMEAVLTRVTMYDFTSEELVEYVATGEYSDKAGAYAIQGLGRRLVSHIEGCVTNVVGLPLCAVRAALATAGVEILSPPQLGYCEDCVRLPHVRTEGITEG